MESPPEATLQSKYCVSGRLSGLVRIDTFNQASHRKCNSVGWTNIHCDHTHNISIVSCTGITAYLSRIVDYDLRSSGLASGLIGAKALWLFAQLPRIVLGDRLHLCPELAVLTQ